MARLIDAEELFNKVGEIKPRNEEHYKAIGEFMNMITNSSTIDKNPCENCIYEEGSKYCIEHCPYEAKQKLCENIAEERYKDLCEYFGEAKNILKSRKEFKAWLERIKWHIHKAEELYEKYEYKQDKQEPCEGKKKEWKPPKLIEEPQFLIDLQVAQTAYEMGKQAVKQERCDVISREAVKEFVERIQTIKDSHNENGTPINYGTICDLVIQGWKLMKLPSVQPKPNYCASCKHNTNNEICLECEYDGITRGMTKYEPSVQPKPIECDDAISREYLKKIAQSEGAYGYVSVYDIATAPCVIPVQPSRKGHWIQIDYQRGKYECSECHTQGYVDTCMYEPKWKYCPICGAEMEIDE